MVLKLVSTTEPLFVLCVWERYDSDGSRGNHLSDYMAISHIDAGYRTLIY